jgi:predicted ATPase
VHLPLDRINVLIGINGAGKSNLISFFKLLSWITPYPGGLQIYVAKSGGANAILHDGSAVTPQITAAMTFETEKGTNEYYMRLFHAAPDTLIFAEEKFRFSDKAFTSKAPWIQLGAGHKESTLRDFSEKDVGSKATTARTILSFLRRCVVYQFHNTSETARMRGKWDIEDASFLKEDAANLGPFLLRLREDYSGAYRRIVETIRQIAPFFSDFVLEPKHGSVLLQWREEGTDVVFGAHQASDGTLRTMALVTLLLQPEENLPGVVILDEPELGLHPQAIQIVAGLLKSTSHRTQIVLATQSMAFVDQFAPEHIVVVERHQRQSSFRRLDAEKLKDWLQDYSLSELWEKNVVGDRSSE